MAKKVSVRVNDRTMYRKFRNGRPAVKMELMPNCGENIKNAEAVYFFKFYSETTLLFNKIGTTKKDVIGRLRAEIGDYVKKFDIHRVEIHRICACGEYPAEGAESALRANFISRYSKEFCKNDRFFGVDIPTEIFDTVLNEYFASQTG